MISHIKTVGVYVADQAKALDFYSKVLGFEVRVNLSMGPAGNWLEVAPPGAQTGLVVYPRAMMPEWANLKPSVVFTCRDVEAACTALTARGVKFTSPPTKMKWGTFAKFADVDGNEFVLTTQGGVR
jgi:lactoylglutathione lyase